MKQTIILRPFLINSNTIEVRPKGSNFVRGTDSHPQAYFSVTPHTFIAQTSLNFKSHNSDCSWLFDTTATHHFVKTIFFFLNYESLENESMAVEVNRVRFPIEG